MTIHFLNCFTCNSRIGGWKTGTLCLLIETNQGPVLVDTGLGLADYIHPTRFTNFFRVITSMPFDPQEAAVNQVGRFGYKPEDIRHIILTHMHFDHCGGLPDFPHAKVHVNRLEYEAFSDGRIDHWNEYAYIARNMAHRPEFILYEYSGDKLYDFEAMRLPFEPEMWLIPLYGHSRGHSGIFIKTGSGWLFHVADAGVDLERNQAPDWMIRLALGTHWPKLRQFALTHPEIKLTASHMFLDFFAANKSIP